jgi:hypothetical protein
MFIVQAYQTSQDVVPHGGVFLAQYTTVFIVQGYQTSQYAVARGGIFLGKWRLSFAGNFNSKMNIQPACALEHLVEVES